MLRILSKREKIILFLTIGISAFALCFNFIVIPYLNRNETLNKEITSKRAKLKKYMLLLSQKDYISSRYGKLSQDATVPVHGADSLVGILAELESLANAASIRIIDVRPQTPKTSGAYKEITIDLRCEGTIEGYMHFLYSVENSILLLRIKRLQLSPRQNSSMLEAGISISRIFTY